MSTKTMSQNIQDILDILNTIILPTLSKHDNAFQDINERQSRMEKKLDKVAEIVTISQKQNDDRFRTIEHKLGIYHD